MVGQNECKMLRTYFDILRETAHLLSSVLQESELIQLLLKQVASVLAVGKALVLLPNREATSFLMAGAIGLNEKFLKGYPRRIDQNRVDQRVLAGEAVILQDISEESAFRDLVAAEEGLSGMAAVPMSVRDRVIGILHVFDDMKEITMDRPEFFILLEILADLGGLALEKARLHQGLYRIAEALSSKMDFKSMLQKVLENTVEEMWLKAASIRLLEPEHQTLRLAAAYGLSESYLAKGDIHVDRSEVDRRVLQGETAVVIEGEQKLKMEYAEEVAKEGILSILVVPLRLRDRTLGVMRVYSAQPRHFGPVAITFLKSIADLVCLAMENAELYAALQERYKDLKLDLADWHRFLALG
jgi:GAF domain-containing protein